MTTSKLAKIETGIIKITMPPGAYWMGDPCYTVPDAFWDEWLNAADYLNNRRFLIADLNGRPVLGIGTSYGDGVYYDQFGNEFGVDAGLIGLVPVELAEPKYPNLVTRVSFDSEFDCRYDSGTIVLGKYLIDTND